MPLQLCTDPAPAAWITDSDLPWGRLVSLGPTGFAAYARLRFVPDPQRPGQSETEVEVGPDAPSERDRMAAALAVLRDHTDTPDEVYFCIWDGWGWAPAGEAAVVRPSGHPDRAQSETVRSYYLLRGALADVATAWELGGTPVRAGEPALPDPAFVWPADHAWCVADDVDPHYAGIAGSREAIARLLEAPGLDVVRVDPEAEQPGYR